MIYYIKHIIQIILQYHLKYNKMFLVLIQPYLIFGQNLYQKILLNLYLKYHLNLHFLKYLFQYLFQFLQQYLLQQQYLLLLYYQLHLLPGVVIFTGVIIVIFLFAIMSSISYSSTGIIGTQSVSSIFIEAFFDNSPSTCIVIIVL